MAHLATKRFNYWGQAGILLGLVGGGLVIGGIVGFLPLLSKLNLSDLRGTQEQIMDKIMKPENASVVRWMQFLTTLFLFFIPSYFYALICHKKPFVHLGYRPRLNLPSAGIVALIMLFALPLVSCLQDLTEMLPWSKATLAKFKAAEEVYNQQVAIIAKMDSFSEYLVAVFMIALLPAVFEETLFRGGIQNLLSRWFKMPVLAIIVTSVIFSAFHFSYLGFLSRVALGFILGWIYYRTGNIWLNIVAHFINNGVAVTAMYITTRAGQKADPSKLDDHFPMLLGLVSVAVVVGLFFAFEKTAKEEIDRPGEEVPMPGVPYTNNIFMNGPAATSAVPD